MEAVENRTLKRLRRAQGWTQADVADQVRDHLLRTNGKIRAIDANYVGLLERGVIARPQKPYRTAFEAIFGTDQLGFYSKRTRRDATREVVSTDRRTFMLDAATATTLPALARIDAPTRIGRDDAAEFATRINSLAAFQRMAGGGAARVLCTSEMNRAAALAKRCSMTPTVRTAWYRGIARLSGSASWAEFDAGNETAALQLLETGMDAAQEADDPGLVGFLAEVGARLHVQMRRPAAALAELRRATGPVPPSVAATCAALAARALALTGDARGMAREVTAADAAFARLDRDFSALLGYAHTGKHAADVGDAFFELADATGRTDPELITRLNTAISMLPVDRGRTRAVAEAKLAHSLYRMRCREEGDGWAATAGKSAAGISSSRLQLVLADMQTARAALS